MRIPYAPTEPAADAPETTKAIYGRITERRKPRPLIPLDLALLHNPAIADGWNSLLGAVRSKTSLNPGLMEMAVCRIAVLNKAVFEWNSHSPLALKGGLSRASLDIVRTAQVVPPGGRCQTKQEQDTLNKEEWAVLCYADQVTKNIEADDDVFDALRDFLDDKGLVEMTATVATYNMVSRFLVALNVAEKNGAEIVMPKEE
jgi:alkylhydroperoxidase family enzyme